MADTARITDDAMIVIPEGMKPWYGGDEAPDDWDGGPVLFRGAGMSMPFPIPAMAYWRRGSGLHPWDIVAYTPLAKLGTTACPFCSKGDLETDRKAIASQGAPQTIYLQPECAVDRHAGRQWCEDDVWGECEQDGCHCQAVPYVRADIASQGSPESFECMIYDAHLPSMTARFRIPEGLPFASGMYEIRRVRRPTAEDVARWAHLPEPPDDNEGGDAA